MQYFSKTRKNGMENEYRTTIGNSDVSESLMNFRPQNPTVTTTTTKIEREKAAFIQSTHMRKYIYRSKVILYRFSMSTHTDSLNAPILPDEPMKFHNGTEPEVEKNERTKRQKHERLLIFNQKSIFC